jgi:hypothetical protein
MLDPPHLAIGGPLTDAGPEATLLDANRLNLDEDALVLRVAAIAPRSMGSLKGCRMAATGSDRSKSAGL